jgi:hypothetical protein
MDEARHEHPFSMKLTTPAAFSHGWENDRLLSQKQNKALISWNMWGVPQI